MPAVRTDGRTYGHVITKSSRMGRLPHFLTHGTPLRALRARELRYYQKRRVGALNNLAFLYELTAEFFSLSISPNKVCEVFGVFDDLKKDCLKRVMCEVFMRFRRKSYLSKPRWRSCKHTQRQRKELVK